MALSFESILIHSDDVPPLAKRVLLAGRFGPPELRRVTLESAAELISRSTGISCDEARELVDLPAEGTC